MGRNEVTFANTTAVVPFIEILCFSLKGTTSIVEMGEGTVMVTCLEMGHQKKYQYTVRNAGSGHMSAGAESSFFYHKKEIWGFERKYALYGQQVL